MGIAFSLAVQMVIACRFKKAVPYAKAALNYVPQADRASTLMYYSSILVCW
jgi:hypothetical protein